MPTCIVMGCGHGTGTRAKKCQGVRLHRGPQDPDLRRRWLNLVGRADMFDKDFRVCSRHFASDDFLPTPEYGPPKTESRKQMVWCARILKAAAVPKLCIPNLKLRELEPAALGRGERTKHKRLLEEVVSSGSAAEAGAKIRHLKPAVEPLDARKRADIVREAINDLEQRELGLSVGAKTLLGTGLQTPSAPLKRKPRPPDRRRSVSPPPLADEDFEDDGWYDDEEQEGGGLALRRKLAVMQSMYSKIQRQRRRLLQRREQLRYLANTYRDTVSQLDEKRSLEAFTTKRRRPARAGRPTKAACHEFHRVTGEEMEPEGGVAEPRGNLTVLRPELDPDVAVNDFPPSNQMLSVPTDLSQALSLVFSLRMEVLALRNRLLQRAVSDTNLRMEMTQVNIEHAKTEIAWLDTMSEVFTPAQKSRIKTGAIQIPWGEEDYLKAIALRSVCRRKTFEYVQKTMKIPLPSMYSCRGVAAFGRFPEVTRKFNELNETQKLRSEWKHNRTGDSDDEEVKPSVAPTRADATDLLNAPVEEKPDPNQMGADGKPSVPRKRKSKHGNTEKDGDKSGGNDKEKRSNRESSEGGARGRGRGRGRGTKRKAEGAATPSGDTGWSGHHGSETPGNNWTGHTGAATLDWSATPAATHRQSEWAPQHQGGGGWGPGSAGAGYWSGAPVGAAAAAWTPHQQQQQQQGWQRRPADPVHQTPQWMEGAGRRDWEPESESESDEFTDEEVDLEGYRLGNQQRAFQQARSRPGTGGKWASRPY